MKKILVIGSEGFVGSYLCSYLEQHNYEVVRFDLKRDIKEDARTAVYELDDIDFIFVLAWDVGGAKYLYRPETQVKQMEWNNDLLINTMKQINHKPFVFISSQQAENINTVYGAQKKLGEVWTGLAPEGCCLRLWNVYGQHEAVTERSHVIGDMINQALSSGEIRLMTDGEERRQFIFIEDVCRACHVVMEQGHTEKYDLTTNTWTSILEVAHEIARQTGAQVIPGKHQGDTLEVDNIDWVPGWEPQYDIAQGIAQSIENFKKS